MPSACPPWVPPFATLLGVLLGGVGYSGLAGKPGVYAEITSVLDWLLENSDASDPVTAQPIPDGCAIPAWFGDNVII